MAIGENSKIVFVCISHLQAIVHTVPKSFWLEKLAVCSTK